MEISITSINGNIVTVSSTFGDFEGIWCGQKIPKLKKYDVEIEIMDNIDENEISIVSESPKIVKLESNTRIVGHVLEYENDVIYLQLGKYLTMVNCSLSNKNNVVGRNISIVIKNIGLYDTGILEL